MPEKRPWLPHLVHKRSISPYYLESFTRQISLAVNQIPTQLRYKIPKDHAFPLNSKALSEALIDVPQYSELSAIFRFGDEYSLSSYRYKLRMQEPVTILKATYSRLRTRHSSPNKFIEQGLYEPKWTITLTALPKEYLSISSSLLKEEALPKLRDWFIETGAQTGYETHSIAFIFDLYKKKLTHREGIRR
ncbi:hypothetical protein [Hahella sp. HN01]|uniref:hypothetical protein n=1 Tax=Hahella sp. HN01 TaxID=2847262 RepID=UPI001C1F01F7|nr:hypothetical protein [Hahella sp. HN01]MBU6952209.1 hypothetical protein [Hahella sp. HN01]